MTHFEVSQAATNSCSSGLMCRVWRLMELAVGATVLATASASATAAAPKLVAASASVAGCEVTPSISSVPPSAKTIGSPSESDDTAAIQSALDRLRPGDWLVFAPGTYRINKHLTVSVAGVTLYGKGATIKATNPTDGAVLIGADNVSVHGLTYSQSSTTRQTTPWAGGISVYRSGHNGSPRIRGAVIQGNRIENSAATGIFIFRADGFTVADNTISRSLADGIHVTAGSTSGRIINNTVKQNGDDMIAVVSYAGKRTSEPAATRYKDWPNILSLLNKNIYIAGNELSDNYWGRGISVVGGSDVTIENNSISRVPAAAGVYIERETSFMTLGNHNILVRGNTLSEIQTLAPSYKPASINLVPTHHGAFEIGSMQLDDEKSNATYRDALSVSNVTITDNVLRSWGFAPIRIGVGTGVVRDVQVLRNKFTNAGAKSLIETHPGLENGSVSCADNELSGTNLGSQCGQGTPSGKVSQMATGASLTCTADGQLQSSVAPKEPTNLEVQH